MIADEPTKELNGSQIAQILPSMVEHENSLKNY